MPNQIQAGFEFEAIFQEAAIGIIVTNSHFEILLSNKFADNLFGYVVDDLLGENISLLILALPYFELKKAEFNEFLHKVQPNYATA
jgi:PAS domain S-box-containing protein